ncbi:MAG: hypothetical protein ACXW2D_08935 [Burkholderiaceae bacterium]
MNRYFKALGTLFLAGVLAACGGGGGSAGGTTDPGTDPGTDPTARVADFAVFTDKTTIANNGADNAQLTVVAVDANRNVVPGATVTVNIDANSVFIPSGAVTDASGTLTGTVGTGGDKTDRDVTVTVSINDITKRVSIRVSGSKLTLAASPSAPTPGQNVQLTATLQDSGGNPIAGQVITFGGTVTGLQNQTVTTNAAGQGTVNFSAPATAGAYTVSASGSGTQALDLNLTVFNSTNAVPAAIIPAGVNPSLSANPNVLSVNAPNSTANKTVLRFLLLDGSNRPVPNVRVRFVDLTTGLPSVGASIASGNSTLYSDTSGSVSTQYISGQNSSPTNGVTVRACYKATDFVASDFNASGNCPGLASVDANLTVAGQALAVSIGDDNLLQSTSGTYIKRFAVTVADSAGRAVANAPVDISVDITHFQKGDFGTMTLSLSSVEPLSPTEAWPSMIAFPNTTRNVWCPNEDANRNGNVDPTTVFEATNPEMATGRGENYNLSTDTNGQPTLEPRKSDILISYDDPTKTTTDASGVLIIRVQYSQRFGAWLAYRVRVTANVAGSQGLSERLFVTDVLRGDVANGSFNTPPYGSGRCVDAN